MRSRTLFELKAFEHVGIRVSDARAALEFYGRLGFEVELEALGQPATYELINAHGVRINLICNAHRRPGAGNILLDETVKHPGVTHAAFVVENLATVMRALRQAGIEITEGPKVEARRQYLFFRDPDGNVIEVNELL